MAGKPKPKVRIKKPTFSTKQSASVRQQYALARKKGGPLYGTGGS